MIGAKQVLDIYLGKDQIAQLALVDEQLYWSYSDPWKTEGYAVSPHLPLHEEISPLNMQRFLRNLLPEGAALEELFNNFHLSRNNTSKEITSVQI